MTQYDTVAKTIGDITVTISKPSDGKPPSAADRIEAFLKWLSEKIVDPDYGVEEGRPDNSLPGAPDVPDQSLPTPEVPARPDNSLPGGKPPHASQLPAFIGVNAKKIAAVILKNTLCDPDRPQPKS